MNVLKVIVNLLLDSRRCSLFLWDKERDELVAKVFDGEIPSDGSDNGKVCLSY